MLTTTQHSACLRGIEEHAEIYADDPSLIWSSKHPNSRFCDSSETLERDEYLKNAYVKWNLARFGSTHWYVGYTPPEDDMSFGFSIHFPAAQGAGTDEGLSLFRMLFEHMECAVRLGRRPFNRDSARALIILDAAGTVRHLSRGAEHLLATAGALSIRDAKLIAASPKEQLALDKCIAKALNTVSHGVGPQAVQLHPPCGRPWIIVLKPSLSSYGPFGQVRCELLAEIHDGLPRIGSIKLLQSLYNLTGREMQIVRLLADGHSIESAANSMEISANTARTHLRAIFSKTSTTRQSELMHLCAGLSANS